MKARGLWALGVSAGLVGAIKVAAQEPGTLPQQWITKRSSEGSFASSSGAMVEKQLRPRGIDDPRVLRAMAKVPREKFVPRELQASAYDDRALPIGFGQTISQPFIVALMTDLLDISADDAVLEVLPRPFRARRSGREVRERCSFESNAKHQLAIKLSPTLAHSSYSDQQWAILHRRPTR